MAARYEVITHDISSMLAEKLPCMCGSATLVMLVSSTCITVTIITENVMAHLRAALIGASEAGAGGELTSAGSLDDFVGPGQAATALEFFFAGQDRVGCNLHIKLLLRILSGGGFRLIAVDDRGGPCRRGGGASGPQRCGSRQLVEVPQAEKLQEASRRTVQERPAQLVASSDAIRTELGWNPTIPDLESIVASEWDWMKAHPNGYED